MTYDEKVERCLEFTKIWPNALWGPAHIVLEDHNFEEGHITWCDGIIFAVQMDRNEEGSAKVLYGDHSDNEIEATRRFLYELAFGQAQSQLVIEKEMQVKSLRWQDVPIDE